MNKKMPAVVNYAPEPNSVEIREVPVPEIGGQDVLLAVQAVGVCGTDIHLAYGQHSWKADTALRKLIESKFPVSVFGSSGRSRLDDESRKKAEGLSLT